MTSICHTAAVGFYNPPPMKPSNHIEVRVDACFLPEQSAPEQQRYVFAYTVHLHNRGEQAARLISRHWVITDENDQVREVRGEGVVGEQPLMQPGEGFEYTSGAVLETATGTMHGSYRMHGADGTEFDAEIPAFVLTIPRVLH